MNTSRELLQPSLLPKYEGGEEEKDEQDDGGHREKILSEKSTTFSIQQWQQSVKIHISRIGRLLFKLLGYMH